MSKILLIDNYDSFTYNLYHYVSSFNKNVEVKRNDKVDTNNIIKNKYKKIIISPGPGDITILSYFFLKTVFASILSFLITSTFFLIFEI